MASGPGCPVSPVIGPAACPAALVSGPGAFRAPLGSGPAVRPAPLAIPAPPPRPTCRLPASCVPSGSRPPRPRATACRAGRSRRSPGPDQTRPRHRRSPAGLRPRRRRAGPTRAAPQRACGHWPAPPGTPAVVPPPCPWPVIAARHRPRSPRRRSGRDRSPWPACPGRHRSCLRQAAREPVWPCRRSRRRAAAACRPVA
jgi:hypothetical protein